MDWHSSCFMSRGTACSRHIMGPARSFVYLIIPVAQPAVGATAGAAEAATGSAEAHPSRDSGRAFQHFCRWVVAGLQSRNRDNQVC